MASCLEEVLGLAYQSNLATEMKIIVGLLATRLERRRVVIALFSSLDQDKKRLLKQTTLPNQDRTLMITFQIIPHVTEDV